MENKVLLPDIWELELHGVVDPRVPNQERIYLRAVVEVELGQYILTPGWRLPDGAARPLEDVFWLSKGMKVSGGYWIVVYTGPGEQKMTKLENGEPCMVLHWGKSTTLFNHPQIVPMLLRLGGVVVGQQLRPAALTP